MSSSSESGNLLHIRKLEGAHNFAIWKKQCYNVMLQKKQAKPIKLEGRKPDEIEDEEWEEMDELARSTIMLSVSDSLLFNVENEKSAWGMWKSGIRARLISLLREVRSKFFRSTYASGEGQSNPSTSGDAGGDHNKDHGNEYGPPLPTQEELREMEHRRLVGEATNMMLNFAKDPKLAKYMTETAFQDVHGQWKATTSSPPKSDSKKQYSEKELEEEPRRPNVQQPLHAENGAENQPIGAENQPQEVAIDAPQVGEQPSAADSLAKFYYPPVAAVTISYPKSAIREERLVDGELKGFGQLHPRSQGVETLGTIYSSSLFPGRAPADRVMLLNYIGGATNTEITNKDETELVTQVDKDVRKMLIKPDAPRPEVLGVRVWPKAIPQFEVGHLDILDDARKALDSSGLEGLFLGGNYVVGVALGRCVEGAYESADSISQYFKKASIRV
ncbi:hypothetical protein L7F22_020959 [Adiantum nelumboides]|nr:hypothetical protein [Adiantum nelumboides]